LMNIIKAGSNGKKRRATAFPAPLGQGNQGLFEQSDLIGVN
jgi:hypothetical protein